MPTVHPRPKLVAMRDDGDGGLDIIITTSDGRLEVQPVSPTQAARFLNQLGEYVERRFRQMERIT